jgi:hypothetical protein
MLARGLCRQSGGHPVAHPGNSVTCIVGQRLAILTGRAVSFVSLLKRALSADAGQDLASPERYQVDTAESPARV